LNLPTKQKSITTRRVSGIGSFFSKNKTKQNT